MRYPDTILWGNQKSRSNADVEAFMLQHLHWFLRDETGQDLVEYSLLICFLALATMWIVGAGRPAVNAIWTGANSSISKASTFASS